MVSHPERRAATTPAISASERLTSNRGICGADVGVGELVT
jgi:hypothetical protein